MSQDFANRLRQLKAEHGWTTADMSMRSGLPKRSLDKYMLRDGASQPGFDALLAMAKGFGVSLDWLVFGSDLATEYAELLVKKCAFQASLTVLEALLNKAQEEGLKLSGDGELLGFTLEYWASIISDQAKKDAQKEIAQAVTKERLLTWAQSNSEQMREVHSEWFKRQMKIMDDDEVAKP
jgi:transcriptional regulator with XRE-family HTH domain